MMVRSVDERKACVSDISSLPSTMTIMRIVHTDTLLPISG